LPTSPATEYTRASYDIAAIVDSSLLNEIVRLASADGIAGDLSAIALAKEDVGADGVVQEGW
jgi:hypothetical protein